MKATSKQIHFIESLLKLKEIDDLYTSVEAQSIRCGQGDELSIGQASRFIETLLSCPDVNSTATKSTIYSVNEQIDHDKFGAGVIRSIGRIAGFDGDVLTIQFGIGVKKIAAKYFTK